MVDRVWCIKDLLDWTTSYFRDKNIASPRLDCELLLGHVLGLERVQLYTSFDEPVSKPQLQSFRALVKRRAELEPVAYLLGKKYFYEEDLYVDKSVFIPRPETELLVDAVKGYVKNLNCAYSDLRICECGTGTGNIVIALARALPGVKITTFEISPTAAELARKNIRKYQLEVQINVINRDFIDFMQDENNVKSLEIPFDIFVSNPPYIGEGERDLMDPGVLAFEPHLALFAANNGMHFYDCFTRILPGILNPNRGFVALEVGLLQADRVLQLFDQVGRQSHEIIKDYQGIRRVLTWTNC